MMNIFLSWSGETSKQIANELKNWLPKVLQFSKPYFTPSDIEKGAKWESEITKNLNECNFGIICITPENTEKPWILFEAGALSNKLEKSRVCPVLFNLKNSDLEGPLATFQTTEFNKEDFKKLLKTLNNSQDNKLQDSVFEEVFETFYPKLESNIKSILSNTLDNNSTINTIKRSDRELIEEILEIVRRQHNSNNNFINPYKVQSKIRKKEIVHKAVANYIFENKHDLDLDKSVTIKELFEAIKDNEEVNNICNDHNELINLIKEVINEAMTYNEYKNKDD